MANPRTSLATVQKLLHASASVLCTEEIALQEAHNRIASDNIQATTNIPQQAISAMDGYAVCLADVRAGVAITQSQYVYAGMPAQPLQLRTCARVGTGSIIPQGADTVIIQEHVDVFDSVIVCHNIPKEKGKHIRQPGSVLRCGQNIVGRSQILQPPQIALLASQGIDCIRVYKKPVIGILSTGDELITLGHVSSCKPWQIYNSNSPMLGAVCTSLGCNVGKHIHCQDNKAAITHALQTLQSQCDVIVTSGGASVGDKDFIHQAVVDLGQMHVWKVAMRPGKPFLFGRIENTPILGLPGNPLSAYLGAILCVRPLLAGMFGMDFAVCMPTPIQAIAHFDYVGDTYREHFLQVQLHATEQENRLYLVGTQLSDQMLSLSQASGIARLHPAQVVRLGDQLRYFDYTQLLHW